MMPDGTNQPGAMQPMTVTVTDQGRTVTVNDVQQWVEERKTLLRQARDILKKHNGSPASLYPHYGALIRIVKRLDQIRLIFAAFDEERTRHADANIRAMVAFFSNPETMDGIDD